MMRRTLMIVALLAAPVPAAAEFETASGAECQAIVSHVLSMLPFAPADSSGLDLITAQATDDGWCRMRGGSPGLEKARFTTLDFRLDGINRVLLDDGVPQALAVRIKDMTTSDTTPWEFDTVDLRLASVAGDKTLLVDHLELVTPDDERLQFSAVVNHVDLSSRGATMMSMGGASLSRLAGTVTVTADGESRDFRHWSLDEQAVIVQHFRNLPSAVLSATGKQVIAAFFAPEQPAGTLSVSFRSPSGVSIFQIGMIASGNRDNLLELLFHEAELTVQWDPQE